MHGSCAGREPAPRGVLPANMPGSYGDACRLRASAPEANPGVPCLRMRVLKALISVFLRGAVENLGLGSSQHDSKCRQSHYGKRELTHGLLPQFVKHPPRVALLLRKNNILKEININGKINTSYFFI